MARPTQPLWRGDDLSLPIDVIRLLKRLRRKLRRRADFIFYIADHYENDVHVMVRWKKR